MRLALVMLVAVCVTDGEQGERPRSCGDFCRDRDANCRRTEAMQAALLRVRADYSGCRADFRDCMEGCR